MIMNFGAGGNKAQVFYILWALENYSDENHFLKQDDIVEILKKNGHFTERKSVARDLNLLAELGFNIHGVLPELDDDGNELPIPRGKIWLEREISDEKLKLLIDSILFSNYIGKREAKDLIDALISLGSAKLKAKSATSRIDGGRVYHQENTDFFKELATINEAMIEVNGESKRINFKYAQYKYKGDEIKLEKERDHVVSPYFFVSQKGNYYLVGYNHKQECLWHYRMDYVKDVKILKDTAKKKDETELKGKDIGEYVTEHPYMFSGEPKGIVVKVPTDRFGIIKDSFGDAFTRLSADEDYITARIYCNELGAFHWAMQYGAYVEVLKPQSLRNTIRNHVEGMAFKYKCGAGDRYFQEIKKATRGFHLELKGIDLNGRTEHFKLSKLLRVYLSDNNLTDISFIKNYPNLIGISIKNNNVSDLSVLGNLEKLQDIELYNLGDVKNLDFITNLKNIKNLILDFDRNVDLSKINQLRGLKKISLSERCSFNLSLDLDKLKMDNPRLIIEVFERDYDKSKKDFPTYMKEPMYKIMLKIAFGFFVDFAGDEKEMEDLVGQMIQKLPNDEREVMELMYRDKLNYYEISDKIKKSVDEIKRLRINALQKISHESYNEKLKKFVAQN